MRATAILVISLAVSLSNGKPASAGEDGPGIRTVRQTHESLRVLLKQQVESGSAEEEVLREKIVLAIRGFLDTNELGRRALQDHLDKMDPNKRDEFLGQLRSLIEDAYVTALLSHRSFEIAYIDETNGTNRAVVTEVHLTSDSVPLTLTIGYRLHSVGTNWRAYDVVADGVSLVDSYRAQFTRIIAKEGYPGLMARMRKRHSEVRPDLIAQRP